MPSTEVPTFGRIAALVVSLVLAAPGRGQAAFHIALISEVMSGAGGDPAAQYVMVRMGSPLPQNAVASSVLAAFSCDGTVRQDLLVVPGNVTAFGPGVPWIVASQSPIGGIVPDFTWASGSIPTPCGMVCWGAPGFVPPAPGSWDHNDPNQHVDCVAYGGYTGPRKTADPDVDGVDWSDGNPSTLAPGNGTLALGRVAATQDNLTDFALVAPMPTNNNGEIGTFGTTTTTTATSTTTTTLAQSKCTAKKIGIAAKKAAAKEKCYAKAVAKGTGSVDGSCLGTGEAKFGAAWAKLEKPGDDCLTHGDATSIENRVDAFVSDVATVLGGVSPRSKCSGKKYGLVGKKATARGKCESKAVGKGIFVDATCVNTVEMKFDAGWQKAETQSDCNTRGDEGSAESTVDDAMAGIVGALKP